MEMEVEKVKQITITPVICGNGQNGNGGPVARNVELRAYKNTSSIAAYAIKAIPTGGEFFLDYGAKHFVDARAKRRSPPGSKPANSKGEPPASKPANGKGEPPASKPANSKGQCDDSATT